MRRLFINILVMTIIGSLTVRDLNNIKEEYLYNINHLNLENKINNDNIHNIKKICSYDYCDFFDGDSIKQSIERFANKYLDTIKDEEIKNTLKVKGIKITKLIYRN